MTHFVLRTLPLATTTWPGWRCHGKKPAPDVYHYVLAALGCSARDCVAFEDSAPGLAAARSAGLATVVTPTAWTADQDFSGAALVLRHLGDDAHPLDASARLPACATRLELAHLDALCAEDQASTRMRDRPRATAPAPHQGERPC